MFNNLLHKNYNATICDITMPSSADSVDFSPPQANNRTHRGVQSSP